MLLESFVAIMAMIAACVMEPGVYFAVNCPGRRRRRRARRPPWRRSPLGLSRDASIRWRRSRVRSAKQTLFARTGGAPSLALGMAHIFSREHRRRGAHQLLVPLRHHVRGAVHPDDHRRRHARRPLHAAGSARPRLRAARPHELDAERASSRARSSCGVGLLPDSGRARSARAASTRSGRSSASPISCWPRIALCVATTILVRMHGARYMWITCVPLAWLLTRRR